MADRELAVLLTGDASGLNAATQEAAQAIDKVADATGQAAAATTDAAKKDAEAAANKKALADAARSAADAAKKAAEDAKKAATDAARAEREAARLGTQEAAAAAAAKKAAADAAKAAADAAKKAQDDAQRALRDALKAEQEAMRKATAEANQLKQAYRQLGPQMTDVVTSLLSGQPAWMVAIQQGGQVKDSFGGVGAAARAMASLVTPAWAALASGGAVIGALALAYNQGAEEAQAYARAIILSGNAAGTTAGQLKAYAEQIDANGSTQRKAAEALAAATASGRVTAANLQLVATSAVEMERVLGTAIGDTVDLYAELGRAPLQASVKLNEQYRYLTVAVYDQIRALMEQGRASEAANVAQRAFADAMVPRLKDVEANLGTLEKAWRAVGKVASETWDAMLGVGRQKSLEDQLSQVEAALAAPVRRGGNAIQVEQGREALRRRRDELRQQIYEQREAAAAQQAAAEATEKRIQTADRTDQDAAARSDAALARTKAQQAALVAAYGDAQRVLDAQRSAGLVTEQEYFGARRALIELDRDAQLRSLAEQNRIEASRKALGADAIRRDATIAQNKAEAVRVQAKAGADLVLINAQEAASLQSLARAQAEYWLQMQRANDARALANGRSLDGLGRGDRAREAMSREAAIADEYNQRLQRLRDERSSGRITGGEFETRLAALRAFYDLALQEEARYQEARQRKEADSSTGYQRALENYLDSVRNVSQQSERMWSNAFTGMEDALVQFVATGKADFRSLANSIISDLIRIYVRQQLISFLATAFGGGGGGDAGVGVVNGSAGDSYVPANVGHTGGVVGRERMDGWRMVPSAMFRNAPRHHQGYIAPGERPAILRDDESVLTPGQMRALGPARDTMVQLTVINQTGQPVQATARQQPGGGIELMLTSMKQSIAGDIAAGSGDIVQALQARFGLRSTVS